MSPEQINAAVQILTKARTDQQVKLRFGARKRHRMATALNGGVIDKDDYRYQWIKQSRDLVIRTLGESAERFNEKYPFDCISVSDFLDVLNSAILAIRSQQEESAKEPPKLEPTNR